MYCYECQEKSLNTAYFMANPPLISTQCRPVRKGRSVKSGNLFAARASIRRMADELLIPILGAVC